MKSIRCTTDLTCVLDGALEPNLRALLADQGLSLGSHIVVVHSQTRTTERYAHLDAGVLLNAVNAAAQVTGTTWSSDSK